MSLFTRLLILAVLISGGILLWDLKQDSGGHAGRKQIVYAGMFGPGEPMQQLYSGPPRATASPRPFGPDHADYCRALAEAFPQHRDTIRSCYRKLSRRDLPETPIPDDPASPLRKLVERYRGLAPAYVDKLVEALGQSDRANRLKLFAAFADCHRQFDRRLITEFEELHPAWTVGLFEDFERRHPDQEIVQRWDGRWVLAANRPRFLAGEAPDIIGGSLGELRILMRENLALPLDQPLPDAAKESWRKLGVLAGEPAYGDPSRAFESDIYDWAIDRARYTVTREDVEDSGNPYPEGRRVLYLLPQEVRTFVVFYNKVHFRLIGRGPDDIPKTIDEFEQVCGQLKAKGKEPIANDGMAYINYWWDWLIYREIGNDNYVATVMNRPGAGRFAGPHADPRYLAIAKRLRKWRDDGFWMKGFSSSQWPAAQRDFGNGQCTFLLTGSWLPAEIASSQSNDPNVFQLGCFFFPRGPDGPDAESIQIAPQGHCVCRQGRNPEGAVLLLKFLMAYGAEPQARKLNSLSGARGSPFPEALRDIEPIMSRARPDQFLDDGPSWFAPKFAKFVLSETYPRFFLFRDDGKGLNPEPFVEEIEKRAQKHYAENRGEAR